MFNGHYYAQIPTLAYYKSRTKRRFILWIIGEHFTSEKFGSNQDRYDACGSNRFRCDPNEVLNMPREAYEQDIKAAHRKLAIKSPPDKNGSNPKVSELFKEVTYSTKSNAEKRMQYDNAGFRVKVFTQLHFLHNFVQSTFNVLSADKVRGASLVVSGDGHYYSKEAIQIIIKMAAANGLRCVWVGQNGMLSTSAASVVIRGRVGAYGSKVSGAFILTASHNPGGPNE